MTLMELLRVWKVVEIGTDVRTAGLFRMRVDEVNESAMIGTEGRVIRISDYANQVIERPTFKFASRREEVVLVKASLRQLGFKGKARRDVIFSRAEKLGLKKCPQEVGPQLRLQHLDQPNRERLVICSNPIREAKLGAKDEILLGACQDLFLVDRSEKNLWLRATCGNPSGFWDNEFEWVFMLP